MLIFIHLLEGMKVIKIANFSSSNSNTEISIPNSYDSNINFSSKVYLDSINTAFMTISIHSFGSGFNNFQLLNEKFMVRNTDRDINAFSGRSILFKIITEFGIFSLIFFIMLIIITFSSKINNEKKIFLLPIILIQLVSGEGYFNGFFLISLLILYFSHGD
jgi:general stress protein CsbA